MPGFSYVELIVVLEEMGAALLCAPFFSTVALGRQRRPDLGRTRAPRSTCCRGSPRARPSAPWPSPRTRVAGTPTGITLAATPSADGWALNGHKSFVIDGHVADLVLVVGRTDGRPVAVRGQGRRRRA